MIHYLLFAGAIVVILLALGIPAVTRMVKIPARLRLAPVDEVSLGEDARFYFNGKDDQARELGFRKIFDFTLPGQGADNINRIYFSPEASTALILTLTSAGGRPMRVAEYNTGFVDGAELSTTNAPISLLFENPDWHQVKRARGEDDLEKLFRVHQKHLRDEQGKGRQVKQVSDSDLVLEMETSMARQLQYQVDKGLFRLDSEEGLYVATPRIALRGIAALLSPFGDDFTFPRLAGFAVGLLVCVGTVLAIEPLGLTELVRGFLPDARPSQISFALYAPAFVLGGLVVGFSFPQKGFLWGFLLSLPAVLFVFGQVSQPIFFSLISAQSGKVANSLLQSRYSNQRGRPTTAVLVLGILIVLGYSYIS